MEDNKVKIKAVVPIKLNNERLPGKNTKLLGGRPLIQYILKSLSESEKIDEVYVYCSDESIKNYFIASNKVKFLKRPDYLDLPTSNFTQIFDRFSSEIDSDIYVFAHATAPFIRTETIDKCIENVAEKGYDSSFSTTEIQDYLWLDNKPLNFDASNLPRSQDLDPIYRETSGVYVFTKDVFKNLKRRIGNNPCAVPVKEKEAIDINNPEDFEKAELYYNVTDKTSQNVGIQLLDCTLRDGGCVNDFAFGSNDINNIRKHLDLSNIDIVEMGYINQNGKPENFTKYSNADDINKYLVDKNENTTYVGMIDYGTFDFNNLTEKSKSLISGIRLAFHKKNYKEALEVTNIISDKGYDVYIQPMVIKNYSDEEIMSLINIINSSSSNIKGVYIVDSFGQMMPEDVKRIYRIFDFNLRPDLKIGFHGHNNSQLAYANSLEFINIESSRNKIVDCSLNGMGKGAGNLPTELIVSYLNKKYGNKYNEKEIFAAIDSVINKYKETYSWGYDAKYLLSAANGCTPSFVSYFEKNYGASLEDLYSLLAMLDNEKKIASNKEHAQEVYDEYQSCKRR